ncbi:MAG: hypothetical protein ACYTF1_10025 [Planctomycetota bacterium]
MWLAVRSVATAVIAIVVAIILHKTAIPALVGNYDSNSSNVSTFTQLVIDNQQLLPWIPVPALIVGITAVAIRHSRGILAPVAAITSLIAVIVIVGSLIAVMMPMYLVYE